MNKLSELLNPAATHDEFLKSGEIIVACETMLDVEDPETPSIASFLAAHRVASARAAVEAVMEVVNDVLEDCNVTLVAYDMRMPLGDPRHQEVIGLYTRIQKIQRAFGVENTDREGMGIDFALLREALATLDAEGVEG